MKLCEEMPEDRKNVCGPVKVKKAEETGRREIARLKGLFGEESDLGARLASPGFDSVEVLTSIVRVMNQYEWGTKATAWIKEPPPGPVSRVGSTARCGGIYGRRPVRQSWRKR